MKYGLSLDQLKEITKVLASYPEVESAVLFGSRVIDTFKEASDIDMAIKGKKADYSLALKLKDHFEDETDLPFFFDIISYSTIKSEDLKKHIHSKGKVIYRKGWREVCLGDIIVLKGGGTPNTSVPEFWNGNIPWISVADFNNQNRFVSDTEKKITQSGIQKSRTSLLKKGDIIISARETVGAIAQISKPMAFNQSCYGISGQKSYILNDYLYYLLKTEIDKLKRFSHGAVFDTITQNTFSYINVKLPPLSKQEEISKILSSFDDKIDLLHQQNKTLEDMAQTLFRQWFVEGKNKTWKSANLGSFLNITTGKKDANYSVQEGGYPFFTCSQNILRAPNYSFEGKAILLAGNGDFNVKRYIGKFEAYQRTYVLTSKNKIFFNFLYVLIKYYLSLITRGAQGSVIKFITKGMVSDFTFYLPEYELDKNLKSFDKIYCCIDYNIRKVKTLEHLHNMILPKLIAGKIRIVNNS